MSSDGCKDAKRSTVPDYFDQIEAALTFARGQAYSKSTAEMVERALASFDRVKEAVRRGR